MVRRARQFVWGFCIRARRVTSWARLVVNRRSEHSKCHSTHRAAGSVRLRTGLTRRPSGRAKSRAPFNSSVSPSKYFRSFALFSAARATRFGCGPWASMQASAAHSFFAPYCFMRRWSPQGERMGISGVIALRKSQACRGAGRFKATQRVAYCQALRTLNSWVSVFQSELLRHNLGLTGRSTRPPSVATKIVRPRAAR